MHSASTPTVCVNPARVFVPARRELDCDTWATPVVHEPCDPLFGGFGGVSELTPCAAVAS